MSKNAIFNFSNLSHMIKWTKNQSINNKIIICRNFENKGVLSGCLTGWLDNKLSEYGKKQASYLCVEFLSEIRNCNLEYHSSDMIRTNESLNILNLYNTNSNLKISKTSLLRDINYGEYEGYYYDGLKKEAKATISNHLYKFSNGESYIDVKYRSILFLLKFVLNKNNTDFLNRSENIAFILSHNIVLKSLLHSFDNHLISGDCFGLILNFENILKNKNEIIKILNEYKRDVYMKDNLDSELKITYLKDFDSIIKNSIMVDIGFRLPDLDENNENNDDSNDKLLNNKFIGI